MTTPNEQTLRTFVAYVEDKPGVLNRIASLFRRRNYNIVSLNVGRTHEEGVSRMTFQMEADGLILMLFQIGVDIASNEIGYMCHVRNTPLVFSFPCWRRCRGRSCGLGALKWWSAASLE